MHHLTKHSFLLFNKTYYYYYDFATEFNLSTQLGHKEFKSKILLIHLAKHQQEVF